MIFIKINKKLLIFSLIFFFNNILSIAINVSATEKSTEEIVKIGLYISAPYYVMDSEGNVSGYYDDVLKLIQEEYSFEYEYVLDDNFLITLNKLETGEIDLIFGVSILSDRINKYSFSENFIAREKFAVFSKEDIKFSDLYKLDDLKIALVKGTSSTQYILEYFSTLNINIEPVFVNTWDETKDLLNNGTVDLILNNYNNRSQYNLVYELEGDQVYIAANKNRKDLLENIDKAINKANKNGKEALTLIYYKYFDEEYNKIKLQENCIYFMIFIFSLSIILLIIPKIKKRIVKKIIRKNIAKEKYLLKYQPIYNPRNKEIVGFEGLLRLLDKKNNLIPPYKFIPSIEKSNMLYEVTIWVLKRAIKDYNYIKEYEVIKDEYFYISINLSLNEIVNDKFVKDAIEIIKKSDLKSNSICLEIIETVRIDDLDKITKNIDKLKKVGFKIAIDDFGIEYSNLDILEKLDYDVLKIDKYFVDGIGKDKVKDEIINFLCKISKYQKKAIVLEGVEDLRQNNIVEKIENSKVYAQGYFYSKPIYLNDIKLLK